MRVRFPIPKAEEGAFSGRGEGGVGAIPFVVFAALAVGLVACLLFVAYVLARLWL
jgi:hypothetical protein